MAVNLSSLAAQRQEVYVNAKAVFKPNQRVKITAFSDATYKLDGWEAREKRRTSSVPKEESETDTEKNAADSMRRARNKVYEIAAANEDFRYFVTLTLDREKVDRYDPEEVGRKVNKWLSNAANRKDLKYLVVGELHEDGAIHFHGLFNESEVRMQDSGTVKVAGHKKPIKQATARRLHIPDQEWQHVFNVADYSYGFSSALELPDDGDTREAVARYITKYITKKLKKVFGKWYWAGGEGLKRELPYRKLNLDYSALDGEEYAVPNSNKKVKYAELSIEQWEALTAERSNV